MSEDRKAARAEAAADKARAKELRPWFKKKRFVIPLALVVLIVIVTLAGGGSDTKDKVVAGGGSTTEESEKFPGRPDSKSGDKERDVGQAAELSGYTATVTKAAFQQEISEFEKKGYLVAEVTLLNRDDKAQSYNPFDWKLITPGGQIIDPGFTSTGQLGSGDLVKGGSITGNLTWEVGAQKGDYFVIFDPTDLADEDRGVWKATI